jgi:hypothetical protein
MSSIAQIDQKVNRKKIDRIEAKARDILVTLVDGQVLRFFAQSKVEVEIVGETKPLIGLDQPLK